MVKSIISMIVAALIIIGGCIYENLYLNKTFDELHESFSIIEAKLENETCTKEDVLKAQEFWLDKKEELHAVIPHTDIKEVDLWISECLFYTADKDYKEAQGKVTVILELFEQIPRNYLIAFENLF